MGRVFTASRLALTALLALSTVACNQHTAKGSQDAAEATKTSGRAPGLPVDIKLSRSADDFARFLAGLPGKAGSPFAELEQDPAWQAHSKAFAGEWSRFDENRVPVLSAFQKKELNGEPNNGGTLFYPFGGPDFVTANLFFPENRNYVFVGLEPAGTVKSAQAFEGKNLSATLPLMRSTLNDLLRRSFFITDQMAKQVRGQITDGLLPLMLVQMVRTGHTIRGHAYVTIDEQGQYRLRKLSENTPRNRGVIVEFQRDGSNETKRLTYFSGNLANYGMSINPEFSLYLANLKPMVTFFKSASYLPHSDNFSRIREEVMNNSNAIAQDDTGIPFRFFQARSDWDVTLYGKYSKPYGSFSGRKNLTQQDLKVAFDRGEKVRGLDFYIGYGYGRAPSNLLVARRRS
ncbi:hypothetical protein F183_A50490 [Bryobacterales bacterium F-183]|nr:hypothetical protein F183_A50490 [Bryobacterales bacterium F-183]